MYNLGIQVLLRELPSIPDLDPAEVRRLLTGAWVEAVEQTRLGAVPTDDELPSEVLRRLASALEIHAVFNRDLSPGTVQACAFVAAEALDIALEIELPSPATARKWLFGSTRTFEHIETALLDTMQMRAGQVPRSTTSSLQRQCLKANGRCCRNFSSFSGFDLEPTPEPPSPFHMTHRLELLHELVF
jgi:hypothetical protein